MALTINDASLFDAIKAKNSNYISILASMKPRDINKEHLEAALATGDYKIIYAVFAKTRDINNPHANKGTSYIDTMIDLGINSGRSVIFDLAIFNIDFKYIKDEQIKKVLKSYLIFFSFFSLMLANQPFDK